MDDSENQSELAIVNVSKVQIYRRLLELRTAKTDKIRGCGYRDTLSVKDYHPKRRDKNNTQNFEEYSLEWLSELDEALEPTKRQNKRVRGLEIGP